MHWRVPPSEGHMSFSTKSRSRAWITCAGQKVATTFLRIEPMVVELQCHIREGSGSSCIFLACSSYLSVFFRVPRLRDYENYSPEK